jgi:hypothetical protein
MKKCVTKAVATANLCSHKKEAEPTKEQVQELIDGADWVTKNVF